MQGSHKWYPQSLQEKRCIPFKSFVPHEAHLLRRGALPIHAFLRSSCPPGHSGGASSAPLADARANASLSSAMVASDSVTFCSCADAFSRSSATLRWCAAPFSRISSSSAAILAPSRARAVFVASKASHTARTAGCIGTPLSINSWRASDRGSVSDVVPSSESHAAHAAPAAARDLSAKLTLCQVRRCASVCSASSNSSQYSSRTASSPMLRANHCSFNAKR
mmetsp:Transcript_78257/g.217324  ORF Transcript_78257/g.217324 Transcript_78257/m.217324 type:complete len:222 (-) Transcript_78257:1300-1965(-)